MLRSFSIVDYFLSFVRTLRKLRRPAVADWQASVMLAHSVLLSSSSPERTIRHHRLIDLMRMHTCNQSATLVLTLEISLTRSCNTATAWLGCNEVCRKRELLWGPKIVRVVSTYQESRVFLSRNIHIVISQTRQFHNVIAWTHGMGCILLYAR